MGYRLRDEIEIAIFLDGKEFPLSEGNALNFLHCAESTKYLVPTVHFAATDMMGAMRTLQLSDATQITVLVKSSGIQEVMHFRANTWSRSPAGGTELFDIDGFLDAPKFRIGSSAEGISATSSGALQEIATRCGLTYSGETTNDHQLWLPRNLNYAQFTNYIANRGYMSDESHMVTAVDLTGNLLYRNVRKPKQVIPVCYRFLSGTALHCVEFVPVVNSGLTNSVSGYRDQRVQQSIFQQANKVHDKLEFTPGSKRLLVNNDVREDIKRSNVTYSPIDFGNVHEQSERAKYQNSRFDALRSLGGEFVFDMPTKLHVLDTIQLTSQPNSEYDGEYVITHKVIYVQE